jgi:hypothetical protein
MATGRREQAGPHETVVEEVLAGSGHARLIEAHSRRQRASGIAH